jgi:hypothetical protein
MSFIDFADVKARGSIEPGAKLVGLKCTEERLQLRAPCPTCNNCGPRPSSEAPSGELTGYIGMTEAKLPKQFHLFQRGHLSQENCLGSIPRNAGFSLF